MRRHQELSLRTAESTSLQRAAGFNKAQVDRFFDKLFSLIEKYKFSPSSIFNADETGVSVLHSNEQKVMSVKGKKQVGKLTSAERGRNISVLLCINASGDLFVPPLFVYPRVKIDQDLKKDAPPGSIFDGQKTGWIAAEGFLKWLHLFVDRVKPNEQKPVLLILDGHSTLTTVLVAATRSPHIVFTVGNASRKIGSNVPSATDGLTNNVLIWKETFVFIVAICVKYRLRVVFTQNNCLHSHFTYIDK